MQSRSSQLARDSREMIDSPSKSYAVQCRALSLAAVLLLTVSPPEVYAFVSTSGGPLCCKHESYHRSSNSGGAWGSRQQGASCAALEERAQRQNLPLAATPEGVGGSEEGAGDNNGSSTSTSTDNGGEEEEVWARAELPMSNDVQVEQATRAVWKVCMATKNSQAAGGRWCTMLRTLCFCALEIAEMSSPCVHTKIHPPRKCHSTNSSPYKELGPKESAWTDTESTSRTGKRSIVSLAISVNMRYALLGPDRPVDACVRPCLRLCPTARTDRF